MSKFSLINVSTETVDKVVGYWVQDHIGTIESATKLARETEGVNGDKIKIVVVPEVSSSVPLLEIL